MVHPLVRTHPETGRDVLFLGGDFMCGIEVHAPTRSALLPTGCAAASRTPTSTSAGLEPADLVIWDEQEHQPPGAVGPLPGRRRMRRCTSTATDRSCGPDRTHAWRTATSTSTRSSTSSARASMTTWSTLEGPRAAHARDVRAAGSFYVCAAGGAVAPGREHLGRRHARLPRLGVERRPHEPEATARSTAIGGTRRSGAPAVRSAVR